MANLRQITVSCEPEWDDEVDVVCTDSGMAGLATAISAIDGDAEVFLADAHDEPRPGGTGGAGRTWFDFGDDAATAEYRNQLTADLDLAALAQCGADLPVRLAGEAVPARRRPRPPFEGSRLREWTAECIASPSGYLYTRVTDWTSEMTECGPGELVMVSEIGSITPDSDDPAGSVVEWLTAEVLDRGLPPHRVRRFDRLVFEEGTVVGAVFSTEDGPLAIRARHGVLVCRQAPPGGDDFYRRLPDDADLRIALIGKDGSRFGRVELLTSNEEIAAIAGAVPQQADGAVTISRS